jgi:hypothetical protein
MSRSLPKLARLRHAVGEQRCPFIGVQRTLREWLITSEFDPERTSDHYFRM